uniref:Uncharacterized protein n=1 Tax=Romanomermis culicivorax TaxID=13658 RepID=A0A915HRL2_ROMCU
MEYRDPLDEVVDEDWEEDQSDKQLEIEKIRSKCTTISTLPEKSSQKQILAPVRNSSNKLRENPDLFTAGGEIFAKKARARIRIKGRVRVRSHGRKGQ